MPQWILDNLRVNLCYNLKRTMARDYLYALSFSRSIAVVVGVRTSGKKQEREKME